MGIINPRMGSNISIPVDSSAALFGSARRAVLGFFFDHPDERFYQRQVVQALAMGTGAVQRELANLVEGGILTRAVEGRQAYYQVNRRSAVFPELHGLVRKTMGAAGVLRDALRPLTGRARLAFIYGSMARRQEGRESDVDVMIVGDDVGMSAVSPLLRPAQAALRREVNPSVYRTAEFRRKLAEGHHFLTRVVAGEKVFLIGDEHELADLGGQRVADAASIEPTRDR